MDLDRTARRIHPDGARFGEWRAPDGCVLRRMDWPQPAGASPRGSLMFINGRGDFIEKYLETYGHFHAAGWNVTSFDWRGQGLSGSGATGAGIFSFDPMVEDLASLIDQWSRRCPGPHVAIAHSMGAHLLLRLLAEQETAIVAATLVAPMLEVNSGPLSVGLATRIARLMCRVGRSNAPIYRRRKSGSRADLRRREFLTSSSERYADELWWRQLHPSFDQGGPNWAWLRAAYDSMGKLTPQKLARIQTPLLLIGAERDRLVGSAAIRKAARVLPCASLHIYPESGHEILREDDPVRLDALRRVDTFFEARAR